MPNAMLHFLDAHAAGEPTRIVVEGGPILGDGNVAQRLARFRDEFDAYRSAIVNEPRGSDMLVGALVVEPSDPGCSIGVIFFNNVGFLGMCGHGTICLLAALAWSGRIKPGDHRIETAVGIVEATLFEQGRVSVTNVPSYRTQKRLAVDVPELGMVTGDIAWGGNWFFLVNDRRWHLDSADARQLTEISVRIRDAVHSAGHPEVDHVELFGDSSTGADSKNFVLCPGNAYDRSPCGTGTSAKIACLAADGELNEGEKWIQESIIGSSFTASYRWHERTKGQVRPTIEGQGFVIGDGRLILDERDPFQWGIRGDRGCFQRATETVSQCAF